MKEEKCPACVSRNFGTVEIEKRYYNMEKSLLFM